MKSNKNGLMLVLAAYISWGLLPAYWALLKGLPPMVVLGNRVFWSMILVGVILLLKGQLLNTVQLLAAPKKAAPLLITALCLCINWLTYIRAMANGKYLEAGLGYYICPLLSIALGALIFREKISSVQKLAVGTIAAGVAIPVLIYGAIPWTALTLAASWSCYTVIRKSMSVDTLSGICLELLMLSAGISSYTVSHYGLGASVGASLGVSKVLLLISTGAVTALPLLALVSGLKSVPLKVVGASQYIAPTLTLLLSKFYFGQMVERSMIVTLIFVWIGILLFFSEGLLQLVSEKISAGPRGKMLSKVPVLVSRRRVP